METGRADDTERLVKSVERVRGHGEVFTPAWLVEGMLDLVKGESERIDSRFLEPACGSGNFLIPVLRRKLATVQTRYATSSFERRHQGLLGLMCVYGIELLADNANECRNRLVGTFDEFVATDCENEHDRWHRAAEAVVNANIVQGDALAMTTVPGSPITFPEWGYLGKGRYQRRDFRFETLARMSSFGSDTLFGDLDTHDIFSPIETYPPMTVAEIAR
ncbi:MAG: SAM-dependent DNA methyltransferase [Mycobacterium sp.]|nr:SAM-dependent DNA methyltransferase [Mycobacterium sp.]